MTIIFRFIIGENKMFETILGLVFRHVLSGASGYLIAQGLASNDQTQAITGGITALSAVVLSAWQKYKAGK